MKRERMFPAMCLIRMAREFDSGSRSRRSCSSVDLRDGAFGQALVSAELATDFVEVMCERCRMAWSSMSGIAR